jgi:RNA polymerase sigma-70 factor (ECF subfamily)
MNNDDLRLSRIDTLWTVVRQAHDGDGGVSRQAQQDLLDRYGGAVRRYLLASLRNEDAADEVFQEFSLKLVGGSFRKAQASQGKFRSFLKTTLYHLIVDYQRRGKRNAAQAIVEEPADRPLPDSNLEEEDQAFTRSWRDELLAKGWSALEQTEQTTGTPYHAVLRFRSTHPDLRSPEIAAELSKQLGKPLTSSSVRVLIHRAREMLAERVLDLVLGSLDNASLDDVEQELIDLKLLEYCRSALQQRRGQPVDEDASN